MHPSQVRAQHRDERNRRKLKEDEDDSNAETIEDQLVHEERGAGALARATAPTATLAPAEAPSITAVQPILSAAPIEVLEDVDLSDNDGGGGGGGGGGGVGDANDGGGSLDPPSPPASPPPMEQEQDTERNAELENLDDFRDDTLQREIETMTDDIARVCRATCVQSAVNLIQQSVYVYNPCTQTLHMHTESTTHTHCICTVRTLHMHMHTHTPLA